MLCLVLEFIELSIGGVVLYAMSSSISQRVVVRRCDNVKYKSYSIPDCASVMTCPLRSGASSVPSGGDVQKTAVWDWSACGMHRSLTPRTARNTHSPIPKIHRALIINM